MHISGWKNRKDTGASRFRAKQGHLFVDHLSAGAKRTHGQPVTFDSVSIGPFVFAMFYYDVVRAYDACNIYIYMYKTCTSLFWILLRRENPL